jgi:ubiquinone biosynthesis protein
VKEIIRVLQLAVRAMQIAAWTVAAGALFAYRLGCESLHARSLDWHASRKAIGRSLRFLFEGLGATFIKVGQIISTRPDLFPPEIVDELSFLQEEVRPFPIEQVRRIIEEDFARPLEQVFVEFEPRPVAAASVAQVHRARLRDGGDLVAVKVRRPSIARWAELDQSIVLAVAHQLELIRSLRMLCPVDAARQFCDAINRQLDFRIEAANNRRFRHNFKNFPEVVFPRLYESICSERVMTMEFIEGYREREFADAGIDPKRVAGLGIQLFCKMTLIDGFVHADLHPGNVRYLRDHRVVLFDLGLTAELSEADRLVFAQTMFYMANAMGQELARHMYELCAHHEPVDYAAYEGEIRQWIERFTNRPLGEIEMTVAIGKFLDIFRRYRMLLDGRYTVLYISMMVAEGLGKKLDPDLDLIQAAKPFLEEALKPWAAMQTAAAGK